MENDEDISRIESFGPVWEERLRDLFQNGDHTHCEMGEELGVSPLIIRSRAIKLGLIRLVGKEENKPKRQSSSGCRKRLSLDQSTARAIYQQQWRQAVKENPAASRTEIRRLRPRAYNWLARYDSQWLDAASPPRRPVLGPPPMIDWKQRDADFAVAARIAAERLKQAPGRPVWVTKSAIAREIGAFTVVTKRADRLPLTIALLEELSETVKAYAIRRVQWAADCLRQEKKRVGYWQLVMRAGMSRRIELSPEVQTVLRKPAEELGFNNQV